MGQPTQCKVKVSFSGRSELELSIVSILNDAKVIKEYYTDSGDIYTEQLV